MSTLRAWALYDFGSTAYSTLTLTIFYPMLVVDQLGGTALQLGLASSGSLALAALLVPVIGAVSDLRRERLPILIWGTVVAAVLVVGLSWANLTLVLLLGAMANIAYHLALDLYDTLLADLAPVRDRGRWSGLGIAAGYLGGLAAIGLAALTLKTVPPADQVSSGLILAAILLVASCVPLVNRVKERAVRRAEIWKTVARQAWRRVLATWRLLPRSGSLGRFLLATVLFNDAVHTVILFFYLFATRELELSQTAFLASYGIIVSLAGAGALLAGPATDRLGARRVLGASLLVWVGLCSLLALSPTTTVFFATLPVAGLAWGMLVTAPRPYLAELAPAVRRAELFGFQGLTEKFGGIVGPALFGAVVTLGGYQPAIALLAGLFLLAFFLIRSSP